VVAEPDAVKIRAEDGRAVHALDISSFMDDLPGGTDTRCFDTENASGSTSQAAAIMEALEVGSRLLLMDEDTCATNFMIRDERMQRLVATDREPITPFVDRVRELHETLGVSTVLVMGGSGDYLAIADTVILMDHYRPEVATDAAREVFRDHPSERRTEVRRPLNPPVARMIDPRSVDPYARPGRARIEARDRRRLRFGQSEVDVIGLEALIDRGQLRGIGQVLRHLRERGQLDGRTVAEFLTACQADLDGDGLYLLFDRPPGDVVRPRMLEVAMTLNRIRELRARQAE
jgi:predicted ABC-class ATPase